ncbi:putative ribonuclease H-like domain-containing protein [Tanacetum coccineum]
MLGHKVSSAGLEVDKAKIDVIQTSTPTISRSLGAFLGHAVFTEVFIKDFSENCSHYNLTASREKVTHLNSTHEFQNKPFESLKEKLTCAPVIVSPNWNLPFELMCDASDFAVGAILAQDGFGYDWSYQADEPPTNFALMTYSFTSSNSEVSIKSVCSSSCLNNVKMLKEQNEKLIKDLRKARIDAAAFQTGLESVEARIKVHKKNEVVYEEDIKVLKLDILVRDNAIAELRRKLDPAQKEKDRIQFTVENFENLSNSLSKLIDSQIVDNEYVSETVVSESVASEPVVKTSEVKTSEVETSETKPSEVEPKSVSEPLIEDWVSNSEDEVELKPKIEEKTVKTSFAKIKFVKPKEQVKSPRKTTVNHTKNHRQSTHSTRGNKRNWNNLMTQKLGSNFEFKNKACYCKEGESSKFYKNDSPNPKRNMIPQAVLMRSGLKLLNTARPVNTDHPKGIVNGARLVLNVFNKAHSSVKRPINQRTTVKNSNFDKRVNIVRFNNDTTARPKVVVSTVKRNLVNTVLGNEVYAIKASACWHMTGNMLFLLDYEEIDGGYVTFGGDPRGGKITGKGTIRTVAERKNRTLIEAARTMLADSKLPTTFWAEAVNTACYVQNKILVIKPHNKTPYELFHDRTPSLSFMRQFGCPITILNTLDHLGKFDGKADEGFFVGYSITSKAFRVFNTRTRIVEESLHITFLENKPNVVGNGPNWLFDIDTLTELMNYEPVVEGNQSNGNAGIEARNVAGQAGKEKVPSKYYILQPLWVADPPFSYVPKSSPDDGFKPSGDDQEKSSEDPGKEDRDLRAEFERLVDKEKEISANSTNSVYTASSPVIAAGPSFVNADGSPFVVATSLLDDPRMPPLEDIRSFEYINDAKDVSSNADFNNLDTIISISPILTTRVHKDHPVEQIIRDLNSAPQTRRMTKQDELLQLKLQKVWILVDLPKGKRAIRTKWVYKNKKDERGIVIRNKMDVKSAFLYGKIEEEVHVYQLPENGFQRGQIDKTLFIKRDKSDILLVQVYVDDIIFGSTRKKMCTEFEKMMHKKFQMSSMGELTFFLASTPMETHKTLLKDEKGEDVDEHLYRSMIGSLTYLTSSIPDIMFVVCLIFNVLIMGWNDDWNEVEKLVRMELGLKLFWSTAKTKTVNNETHIHAKVEGKTIVISESSVRRDLQFDDEDGIACLTNTEIFENLQLMGYEKLSEKLTFYKPYFSPQWKYLIHTILQCLSSKSTAWNEFGTNIASAVICLAKNQKFNFSKLIFDGMMRNLDSSKKFLMYPRQGKDFSGTVTPLFSSMLAQQTDMGEGEPTNLVADEAIHEERGDNVERDATTVTSLDAKQDSGGRPRRQETIRDRPAQTRIKLKELMEICTKLSKRVLDFENVKTAQALEITNLKKRVKKLERKNKSRTLQPKRKGRKIYEIDQDEEVTLVNASAKTQGRTYDDDYMIDTNTFDEKEVFADQQVNTVKVNVAKKEISAAEPVTTTGETVTTTNVNPKVSIVGVTTASVLISAVDVDVSSPTRPVDDSSIDDLTLAETLMAIKSSASRPQKLKRVIFKEPSEPTTSSRPQPQIPTKDKGKGIMQEPEKPMKVKGKDPISYDIEVAQRLQAELDEEVRLERENEEESSNVALIEEWDDVQARINADKQLAEQIQA